MLIGVVISGAALTICGFVHKFNLWMVGIGIAGFGLSGLEITSLVYVSEISGKRFRNNSNVVLNIAWGLSQVLLGIIFPLLQNWRFVFVGVMGVPFLGLVLVGFWIFDETPRYLVNKHKIDVSGYNFFIKIFFYYFTVKDSRSIQLFFKRYNNSLSSFFKTYLNLYYFLIKILT